MTRELWLSGFGFACSQLNNMGERKEQEGRLGRRPESNKRESCSRLQLERAVSGKNPRSDNDAVKVRRISGWIADTDRVGPGVQLHGQDNRHWIVEGAAVQIKLPGCSPVDPKEVRARSAGLVVDLQLIGSARRHGDIRECYGIRGASADVTGPSQSRRIVAESSGHYAAQRCTSA
jgi:hypothetical protein